MGRVFASWGWNLNFSLKTFGLQNMYCNKILVAINFKHSLFFKQFKFSQTWKPSSKEINCLIIKLTKLTNNWKTDETINCAIHQHITLRTSTKLLVISTMCQCSSTCMAYMNMTCCCCPSKTINIFLPLQSTAEN